MSKIPEWVEDYPYELDRTALANLANASDGPLDKPREMNFSLYDFKSEESLQGAAQEIEKEGWSLQAFQQADNPNRFVLEAQKQGYVINLKNYEKDSLFFQQVAKSHNAKYDGWFASN